MAACSGSGGGDDSAKTLSRTEAAAAVKSAVLRVADLGSGWKTAPGEDADDDAGAGDDKEFERCVGIADDMGDDTVAESPDLSFTRARSNGTQWDLQQSTAVLKDATEVEQFVDVITRGRFSTCLRRLLDKQLQEDSSDLQLTLKVGKLSADEHAASGADHAVMATVPFAIGAGFATFKGRFDFGIVSNGPIASTLFVSSLGDVLPERDVKHWVQLLADRQDDALRV